MLHPVKYGKAGSPAAKFDGASPLAILESEDILLALKKHWIANHENLTQPEKFVEDFFEWLKTSDVQKGHAMSVAEIKKHYKKKLKEYSDSGLALEKPGDMFLEIMEGELAGAETILDFGCGKLTFLKNIAESNQNIKKLIGMDSKSQPDLADLDLRIEFVRSLGGVADASVDLAVIKLVLHHLENEQQAKDIFAEIQRVLRPNGKLIVFEESFPECHSRENGNLVNQTKICDWIPNQVGNDIAEIKSYLAKFNLEMSEVTEDFLRLSKEDKIKFLFLNDWLMNLQNAYMPWTLQYRSMEEWKILVESVGFREKESHFLGAIKHRKRKQGMTAMLNFY